MPVSEKTWFVADIGGTNMRFGIATPSVGGRPILHHVRVLDTEGGHAAYAPQSTQEDAIASGTMHALRAGFMGARRQWTRTHELVCGVGYRRGRRFDTSSGANRCRRAQWHRPAQWSSLGIFQPSAGATVAGDRVLMQGAWDGIYLMGELLQATRPWIESKEFRVRFTDKEPFADAMSKVPVRLITHIQPVLLGAACIALARSTQTPSVATVAAATT